jgi:hypothetical protein
MRAMASAKPKSKSKTRNDASASGEAGTSREASQLRQRGDKRTERRFDSKGSSSELVSVLASSGGAILVGAGVFGQFLRSAGPHPWALPMLGAGAVAFAAGAVMSRRTTSPVRVGDAGVGIERSDGVERLAWHEITSMELVRGVLKLVGEVRTLTIDTAEHLAAAALALDEARARIPAVAANVTEKLERSAGSEGEALTLEPPQLAGLRCAASDRVISFENDARLCGRCGAVYHRDDVPACCKVCDAKLKG